jgi:hypothetical protein
MSRFFCQNRIKKFEIMRPAKFIEVKIYVKITKKKKITRFSPDISKTARWTCASQNGVHLSPPLNSRRRSSPRS